MRDLSATELGDGGYMYAWQLRSSLMSLTTRPHCLWFSLRSSFSFDVADVLRFPELIACKNE
jgi:hypothetical protein